jgi:hypothetical protein
MHAAVGMILCCGMYESQVFYKSIRKVGGYLNAYIYVVNLFYFAKNHWCSYNCIGYLSTDERC